jgi:hypothetical protein
VLSHEALAGENAGKYYTKYPGEGIKMFSIP